MLKLLWEVFARYGIPWNLVFNNGPQFTSVEFQQFMAVNDVKHVRSTPYDPPSNEAAERLVQTVKQALCARHQMGVPLEMTLAAFLLQYRTTPHSTTEAPPSVLFFGHDLRIWLDMLKPDIGGKVRDRQGKQKDHHDQHSASRVFRVGNFVWVRNLWDGPQWITGLINRPAWSSFLLILVRMPEGELWHQHVRRWHSWWK